MDDLVFFADDKRTLWRWREAVIERLAALRLTMHEAQAQVRPTSHGIPFLGFVVYPTHRLLKRRKGIAYQRKLRLLMDDYHGCARQGRHEVARFRAGLDQPRALRRYMGLARGSAQGGASVTDTVRRNAPLHQDVRFHASGSCPRPTTSRAATVIPSPNACRMRRWTSWSGLVEANNARGRQRANLLVAADAELDKVRFYLRLAFDWRWLTPGQYEHAGRMVAELGRLLGGWQKTTRQQAG